MAYLLFRLDTYFLCDDGNERGEVIKLRLFQHALFSQIGVDDQLVVSQVVQNGRKIARIAVDQKGTAFVLKYETTSTRFIFNGGRVCGGGELKDRERELVHSAQL